MIPSVLCYVPPSLEFLGPPSPIMFRSGLTALQIFCNISVSLYMSVSLYLSVSVCLCLFLPLVSLANVERGGALVESIPFNQRAVVSNPALIAKYRDLGQVLNSQLPEALWRETPAKYPCCVGSASE